MIVTSRSSWVLSHAPAANTEATVTRPAPAGGLSHYITSVDGSFDTSVDGVALTLSQASTEIARWYVYTEGGEQFDSPIKIAPGTAVTLALASGGLTTSGTVTLTGYTL